MVKLVKTELFPFFTTFSLYNCSYKGISGDCELLLPAAAPICGCIYDFNVYANVDVYLAGILEKQYYRGGLYRCHS